MAKKEVGKKQFNKKDLIADKKKALETLNGEALK